MALIGNNNRQSVLNDDASLFQIPENKSEKQKWTEMDNSQKLQYFTDYYLIKCIIFIAAAAAACLFIWNILKPKKEQLLFLAVVQNALIPEEKEDLEQILSKTFITDQKKQEIRIDDTFSSGYESDAKLSAYLAAQEIDLIITNEKHFQELAEQGCFEDLNAILPEFTKKNSDSLYWTEGYTDNESETEQMHPHTNIQNNENTKAYGIIITDSEIFQNSWYNNERAVAGITQNSLQKENAKLALTDILFNYTHIMSEKNKR